MARSSREARKVTKLAKRHGPAFAVGVLIGMTVLHKLWADWETLGWVRQLG